MSVRRIRISSAILNSFLRNSELWDSSLPDDVEVIGIAGERIIGEHEFVLLVKSEQFPVIGEGQLIPFVEPVFRRK